MEVLDNEEDDGALYACDDCGEEFDTLAQLEQHDAERHDPC